MESLTSTWSKLSAGRRIVIVLAVLAVAASVYSLSRGAGAPQMSLLYGGLEQRTAGDVITALEQRGVAYDVRGDAIYVPANQRDELRMSLAAEGLPANSAQGYELLDSLSGFGTTSQMFDAAYWRAKEGELARTIIASPHIRAARVHISNPTNRPFQRENRPTAAVTVTTTGLSLTQPQANALRFLVASSVSGLVADDVAVIDTSGGLITGEDPAPGGAGQAISDDLRSRAERLLFARVGPGNAVVEVSVETITETESIIERRIDPDSRVAISTEVEERTSNAQDSGGAGVTVASNLPAGDAPADGGNSNSQDSQTRSLTNFEVSETSREILREPGAIRRLTVAVLVNDIATSDENGVIQTSPRSPEELDTLRELVGSAVGFDEARGDEITIQSLPFEATDTIGSEPLPSTSPPLDMMTLIQLGVLALVALILGLFVVRPILSSRTATALPAPVPEQGQEIFPPAREQTDGAGSAGTDGRRLIEGDPASEADPVSRLRQLIEERQDETIQILQDWIEEPDHKERA